MNTNYHIDLVKKPTTGYQRSENDHVLAEKAQELYPTVAAAMLDAVVDGDWQKYCASIEEYDRFVWIESHRGDKSNIFSYKKIKVSPSWTEQLWAPVFERVRKTVQQQWNTPLVLIQNVEVVESWSQGPSSYKDVDGGIGIVDQVHDCIMPVVVAEDKTGHFCKTACTGVDGIMRRVLAMNPHVLGMCITDNNVSVGQDSLVENVYGAGGILISQRGTNGRKEEYPQLNADKFNLVETICLNYLATKTKDDFLIKTSSQSSNVFLRENIDRNGYYIPSNLQQYL
jgi:hypothetical protein